MHGPASLWVARAEESPGFPLSLHCRPLACASATQLHSALICSNCGAFSCLSFLQALQHCFKAPTALLSLLPSASWCLRPPPSPSVRHPKRDTGIGREDSIMLSPLAKDQRFPGRCILSQPSASVPPASFLSSCPPQGQRICRRPTQCLGPAIELDGGTEHRAGSSGEEKYNPSFPRCLGS